jgi:hypothetical protein
VSISNVKEPAIHGIQPKKPIKVPIGVVREDTEKKWRSDGRCGWNWVTKGAPKFG